MQKSKVGTLHQERNIFFEEHHAFFEQPASSMLMIGQLAFKIGQNIVTIVRATFLVIKDVMSY